MGKIKTKKSEQVEENFQIPQIQKTDHLQKVKQEVLVEALVQENPEHKLLFEFYFSYIFLILTRS